MASRPDVQKSERPDLTVEQKRRCILRLQRCIGELENFVPTNVQRRNPPEVLVLETSIEEALVAAFGERTASYTRYSRATNLNHGSYVGVAGLYFHDPARAEAQVQADTRRFLAEGKEESLALLRQAIRALEDEIADQEFDAATAFTPISAPVHPEKVFVVHGHDGTPKVEVARFIEMLRFEAVILHERPNKGRTLITKFREEADGVGYAVVLMTPDDVGKAEKTLDLKSRARQNVVFELGFFVGKLGPERVTALVKGDIEKPSDFDGVVYISLEEDWQKKLGIELQVAGYEIDWNKVMKR
ncbi:TIR domain-containing protein [Methylocapsa acidiphila]|uniref:TIR domain-containing protein n=1 Tax=Methylocapsa acidiphila TaxID=133552 RepID=UPI0004786BF1|nr:nucleotide-binding protein [Methylocapsa acidiphila]